MRDSIFLSFVLKNNPGIKGAIMLNTFRKSRLLFNEVESILENSNNKVFSKTRRADLWNLELQNTSRLLAFPYYEHRFRGLKLDFIILEDINSFNQENFNIIYSSLVRLPHEKGGVKFIYFTEEDDMNCFVSI